MKLTDITVVLDRSGSMALTKHDAIGGFNQLVEDQKNAVGDAVLSLIQFDNEYEVVFQNKPIKEVEPLTDKVFIPRGMTALVDAIGITLANIDARLKKIKKAERPDVIVTVITDGGENSSEEYNSVQLQDMMKKYKKRGWQILFVGANQDAIKTAANYGIGSGQAMTYAATGKGTQDALLSLSGSITKFRTMKMCADFDPTLYSVSFSDADRNKQQI